MFLTWEIYRAMLSDAVLVAYAKAKTDVKNRYRGGTSNSTASSLLIATFI